MKIISRTVAVAVSATAAVAFLAPAANAAPSDSRGQLRVCALGLDAGDEVEVEIWGRAKWAGDLRGCKTFRAPRGIYWIDIDLPEGYRLASGDDDRKVRVHPGERTTVRFRLDETGDRHWDRNGDRDWDRDWDRDDDDDDDGDARFVRVDEDDDCPDGYRRSRVNDEICIRG